MDYPHWERTKGRTLGKNSWDVPGDELRVQTLRMNSGDEPGDKIQRKTPNDVQTKLPKNNPKIPPPKPTQNLPETFPKNR